MSTMFKPLSKEQLEVGKTVGKYAELIMNVPTNDSAKNEINRIFLEAKTAITKHHGTTADIKLLQDAVNKKMTMLESHVVVKSQNSLFGGSTKPNEGGSDKPAAVRNK